MQWLLICVVGAFGIATAISYFTNTQLSRKSTEHLLSNSLDDVLEELQEKDVNGVRHILNILSVAIEDSANWANLNVDYINKLRNMIHVSEINIADSTGILFISTVEHFIGFDMSKYDQPREFLCLLDKDHDPYYLQGLRQRGADSIPFRYSGMRFKSHSGFLQVGYDQDIYYENVVNNLLKASTRHRRIGDNGFIFIVDKLGKVISSPGSYICDSISQIGIDINKVNSADQYKLFDAKVFGSTFYCMHTDYNERYEIIAMQPEHEATLTRDKSVYLSSLIVFFVFLLLFFLIYWLIKKLVVKNIDKVNTSLSHITDGNLNEVVNVRDSLEFSELSDDINMTVDRLKEYIHQAETRLDADLLLAKSIQMASLPNVFPAFPDRKDFDLFASYDPAKVVGGDFYDFYFVSENKIAITIADVSGKGIPAAMFMMRGKSTLKNRASSGFELEEVFNSTNSHLCKNNDTNTFITVWMAIINLKTGEMKYVNAGHNAPLLRHADGLFEYLTDDSPCLPIGAFDGIPYRVQTMQLRPGDELFLYTDGVTEAENIKSELYSDEYLLKTLNSLTKQETQDPMHICHKVRETISNFAKGAEQSDDITMLCFKLC